MFKRLRERIAEEATKFPVGQDLITLSDSSSVVVPHTSSQQFSIGEDEDGSLSEQSTPQKKQNASSSDAYNSKEHSAVFADLSFGQEYRPSKKLSYVPQSDIESEREDPPTLNLDGISKDQLLTVIQTLKAKSYKYKNKYAEVVKNYKELREEKVKIETTLIENQDKGLRRIAELREQCQLEQKAKAHLEENLRLLLEEKDSRICVLETQINLLKGDKSSSTKTFPDDCDNQYFDGTNYDTRSEDSTTSMSNDISVLQEKVERLQHQHNQDKKTITSQKDQISLLRKQNENLSQELEDKMKYLNNFEDQQLKLKSEHESIVKSLQDRLTELEKQQEENIMSMAETKRNMHVELELKEKQLVKAEEESKTYQAAAEQEKQLVTDLKKQHEERVTELLRQLEVTEKTLEEEKQSLLHELGQGKTAAINLMQQECAKKLSATEEEWKSKYETLQAACEKSSQSQMNDVLNTLKNTQDKLKQAEHHIDELDSSVASLEKENVSLKNSVEKLECEVGHTTENYEKMKVSYSDYESLKEKEILLKKQESVNNELNGKIEKYENAEKELQALCSRLSEELHEQKNTVTNLENEKSELIKTIKMYEMSQKELKAACGTLKNEISNLNQTLTNKLDEIETLSIDNCKKSEEIDNIKNQLKRVGLNEKLVFEKLHMSVAEGKEFEAENAELLLQNRLLSDEIQNLTNSLLSKEKELKCLNETFSKAHGEICQLNDSLEMKESMLNQAVLSYKQVESLAISLEKQQVSMKQTLDNFQSICKLVFKSSKYISKRFEIMKELFESNAVVADKEVVPLNLSLCDEKDVKDRKFIAKSASNESDFCEVNCGSNENSNINTGHLEYKNEELTNVQSLPDNILVLKKENANLKKELYACKSFSELQDIEFAKNITILQQSLSDLQEERNNLSLVLQNIENDQMDRTNKQIQKELLYKKKDKIEDNDTNYQRDWEIRIIELNSKIKSEIEALSMQTEISNKELRNLQEQFKSNQDSFSEKVSVLNSKLLFRTEALINLKEEFDSAVEISNSLKELLEGTKLELCEKNEMLSSFESNKIELEDKCKTLKEKYYKRECELKESHNSLLAELKNQTKLTIDKLNEQLKESNKLLKEKDEIFFSQLGAVEHNYQVLVSYFQSEVEKSVKCQAKINEFNNISCSFDTRVVDCTSKLDHYCSKITNLSARLNLFVSQLKEKDKTITQLNSTLLDHEDQLKVYSELHKEFNKLQNEFNLNSQHLQDTNKELQCEKDKLKSCEIDNLKLKDENEKLSEIIKEYSSKNTSEKNNLQLSLDSVAKELKSTENKYSETCSNLSRCEIQLREMEANYETALNDIASLNVLLNEQRISSESIDAKMSEQFHNYECIISQIEGMIIMFDKYTEKSNQLLDEKNIQITGVESKFSVIKSNFHSYLLEISDLKSKLASSLNDIDSTKVCLDALSEEKEEELKICENAITKHKVMYEKVLYHTTEMCNNIISQMINIFAQFNEHRKKTSQFCEKKEIQLTNIESKFSFLMLEYNSKVKEILALKSKLSSFLIDHDNTKAVLEQEKEKFKLLEKSGEDWKLKYKNAASQVEEISVSHTKSIEELKSLLDEKETIINNTKIKISDMEQVVENFKLQSDEISLLREKLTKCEEDLQDYQKLHNEQNDKIDAVEGEKCEWKVKYDTVVNDFCNATNAIAENEKAIQKLCSELDEKNNLLNSMISQEKFELLQKHHTEELKRCKEETHALQLELEKVSLHVSEKESLVKAIKTERNNLEAHHEESLKCIKDKLQNAEKNYKTQMEEMKLKINQLETENNLLISEKENLLHIQNQFKELKNSEVKIQSELKSKEEEIKKWKEKLETSNKEQMEKNHTFQESMKDKENMILKLKVNIESLSKEHSGNVEELYKKIKRLEQEREQLMLQAQERVSATEAKCREDIKLLQKQYDILQEKYNIVVVETREIENLRNEIVVLKGQVDESLKVVESNKVYFNQEISLLTDKLADAEIKLSNFEEIKLNSESELSTELEKLQQENKQLLCNNDHVEKLKAEKEELNEKLKNAVQQVNKIKDLEKERDNLLSENEELSKDVVRVRTIENENISMREKLKVFEENTNVLRKQIEDLTVENETLKSEISSLKSSVESEKDLVLEREKLKNRILQLENCVSDPQNMPVKNYVESLKKEYEAAIKVKDDDMLSKLKQLVRDFSIQMDVKDKDSEQMISELMEKNQHLEETLQREYANEVAALRQELFEKDCALEEMRDNYEESIQEKDVKIKKQELTIRNLSPKETLAASAESVGNGTEPSDWDDTWVVPDEVVENSSPVRDSKSCEEHTQQIESLQEELSKCNSEIKELKLLLRLSPPDSVVNNNNRRDSLQSLPEPTEFEYLKNIIYEYMMGKEPVTLAKVIAAVLRFSDVQTQQVIRREEARHPTK